MDKFVGKWKLQKDKTEKFDDFMDALGLPSEKKDMIRNAEVLHELKRNGDEWTTSIQVVGTEKKAELKWKFDQPCTYTSPQGFNMTTTISLDGSKFVEKNKMVGPKGEKAYDSVRSVDGDIMTVSMTRDGKTMIEKFKRV